MFAKHAKTVPNALTKDEMGEMLKANRERNDVSGW
jgi:peroxygenase